MLIMRPSFSSPPLTYIGMITLFSLLLYAKIIVYIHMNFSSFFATILITISPAISSCIFSLILI